MKASLEIFETFPELFKLRGESIAMRLRIDSSFGRRLLNFLTVFVQAGQKEDVPSSQSPVARQHICRDGRVRVTDMRHVVDVIDGSRDVKRVGTLHGWRVTISG